MSTATADIRPHPFTDDRRALGLPRCRDCGLFFGAAVHHPSRTR